MEYTTDNLVFQEAHYRNGRTSEAEQVVIDAPITTIISSHMAAFERSTAAASAAGALLVFGGALLGWYARGLFAIPYDYHQLAWLIPLACFFVSWGNRRAR